MANLWLTIAWAALLPIAVLTGLWKSVAFISVISIYACFISHLTAWRADVPTMGVMEENKKDTVDRIEERQ